jgi:GAF domain-containing protein
LRLAGRAAEAAEPYREAVALARTFPPGDATLADLLVSSGKVSQTRSDFDAALSAFGEAVRVAEERGQDDVRARAQAARARIHYFKGNSAAALGDARDAVAAARRAGDEEQEAIALTFEGFLLVANPGGADREAGLAALERAIAISERRGDRYTQNLAHSYLGNAALAAADLDAARGAFEQNRRICRAIGARDEEVFAVLNLAAVALEADEFPEAADLAAEAAGWALEADRRFPLAMARALQGAAAVARGETRDGFDRLDEALALAATLGNTYLEGQALALAIQADLAGGRSEAAGGRIGRLAALGQGDLADRLALLRGTWLADQGRQSEARADLATALASENRVIARRAAMVASRDLVPAGAASGPDGIPFMRACAVFAERAAADGVDDLLDRLAGTSLEMAHADRALILLYEQGRLVTRLARGSGSGDWSYSTTIAKRVLWSGEPLRIADTRADERLAESRSVAEMPLRSVICVPLATHESNIGVLYLDRPTVAGPFLEEAATFVEALAAVASLALARAWRVRDLERELAVEAALGALATAVLAEESPDAAVRLGLETALHLVPADRALFVDLTGDGTPAVRVALGPGGRDLAPGAERVSSSIVGWVAETGEATAILDATEDASWGQQQSVPALDLRAVLCVPCRRAGKVAGALWLDARDPAVQYSDRDVRVAERIARILDLRLA